jgi:outer membrane protein assembly factor BamA
MYIEGNLNYSKSSLVFYGLGNNSPEIDSNKYITKIFEINAQVTNFRVLKNFQTGLVYEFSNYKMVDKQSNPNLFDPSINGIDGGIVSGLGFAFLADYRDNNSYPSKGFYTKASAVFFRKPFGSSFSFDKYVLDVRQYYMPVETHIIAIQIFGQFSKGSTPFFSMPQVGGSSKMRGYFEGRYRDMQYMTAQAEYRKILFWRIGAAAFYSVGEVSPNFKSFKSKYIRHTYGFGLRFVFDPKEKINLRVDVGVAEKKTGVYFNLEEAF